MVKSLVTKLNIVVDDDKLQPVGGIRVFSDIANYDSANYSVFASTPPQKIITKHNGILLKETTIGSSNTQFRPADSGFSGKVELIIPNKYALTRIDMTKKPLFTGFSFNMFEHLNNLDFVSLEGDIDGDISNLKCNELMLNTTKNLAIDIAELNVKKFTANNSYNIKGDIMNVVNKPITYIWCERTNVSGEVITFAEKRADMNRLDGLFFRGGKMTLNGKIFGSINVNVTFNSATSIAITNNSDNIPTYTLTKETDGWKVTETPK